MPSLNSIDGPQKQGLNTPTRRGFKSKSSQGSRDRRYVEMKLQGYTTKQVMQELNIKNETQVKTWFRWYKNGETHRFHQQVGKQYSYNK